MVPVGGAIIAGFDESFIKEISKMYPGMHPLNSKYVVDDWSITNQLQLKSQYDTKILLSI